MFYKLKGDVVVREIAGEMMLIPTGASAKNLNGMVALTQSGALIIEHLKNGCDLDELVDALCERYEVSREQAEADTLHFLKKMEVLQLI